MSPIRVAFLGPAGAGKSTCADHLKATLGGSKYSFATALKFELALELGIKVKDLHEAPMKYQYREAMQAFGDRMRDKDPAHFVRIMEKVLNWSQSSNIFVDDPRFTNEIDLLRDHGFLFVRLDGPPTTGALPEDTATHRSETEWQTSPYDLRLPWDPDLNTRTARLNEWLQWVQSTTTKPSPVT